MTFGKEGYAINQTFTRVDYMLQCGSNVCVFTDLRNILFALCSSLLDPSLGHHKVMKMYRWAIFLSQFNYKSEHFVGKLNVMPDVITQWLREYRRHKAAIKRVSHQILQDDIVPSPLSKNFVWLDTTQLLRAQRKSVA